MCFPPNVNKAHISAKVFQFLRRDKIPSKFIRRTLDAIKIPSNNFSRMRKKIIRKSVEKAYSLARVSGRVNIYKIIINIARSGQNT